MSTKQRPHPVKATPPAKTAPHLVGRMQRRKFVEAMRQVAATPPSAERDALWRETTKDEGA